MNLGRCPVCHAHISLEAIVQDDAGRELLALLAGMPSDLARALVRYLGLFRAPKRDLTNDRTLRLAREVLGLAPTAPGAAQDGTLLAWALAETVESLRAKGGATPIKNHNYLKRVIEGAVAKGGAHGAPQIAHDPRHAAQPLQSKTALAMAKLVEGV